MSIAAIAQTPLTLPDCQHTISFSEATYISNVRLGSINNSSTRTAGGYANYTALSTNVAIGSSYTITVKSSGSGSYEADWAVYIDYNKNGFAGDAGELIGSVSMPSGSSTSFTFTPPVTAFNGPTTLQVRMTQSRETHCVSYFDKGEKEDYTVNITGGYCYSHGLNTNYEYINKFVLGSINNLSGNNNGYRNYTSQSTNLTAGFSYTLSLYPGYGNVLRHEYVRVYIDYNKDKIFGSTIPFETSELVGTMDGFGFMSKQIQIPIIASTGIARLRIQMSPYSNLTDPCAVFTYGEVEEYTVNILPPVLSPGKQENNEAVSNHTAASIVVVPNPSKAAEAKVSYTVINTGTVSIKVADISGRILQTIAAGNKTAGTYNLSLSAIHALTIGTYFITIEQDNKPVAQNRFVITE